MLRLLKLKPFRKLKVVQRLLERRQARKLRSESAGDFTAVEDEQQIAEQHRTGRSLPPAPRKVSGDDDTCAPHPALPSRQRHRASNDHDAKYGGHASFDAPVSASVSVEGAAASATVDTSACSQRPYHVRMQASSSSASAQRSSPPPNPYDNDNGDKALRQASRLCPDSSSTSAADVLMPSSRHALSHQSEWSNSAATRDDSDVLSTARLQADTLAVVVRGDRDDSRDHREAARRRKSSNRLQSDSDGRRRRSKVFDEQSTASADCSHTDDVHRCPCPTATIAATPAAKTLSTGATTTGTDGAAPVTSPRSRLRRRHSMPARDKAAGSGGDSAMQRLHRLRRSFGGRLRASTYTELTCGDTHSVLGQEASTDERREPFSKTFRRSLRESFRYGIQSLSAAGIGSGIGMAMAPSFAMPMTFGGVTTTV